MNIRYWLVMLCAYIATVAVFTYFDDGPVIIHAISTALGFAIGLSIIHWNRRKY